MMTYKLSWYHEKRIILIEVSGDLPLEEIRQYGDEIYELMEDGTSTTHLIVNVSKVGEFPPNLTVLRNAHRFLQHPRLGWIIMIGGPIAVQAFARVATHLARIDYRSARNMKEAVQLLLEADATLAGIVERSR